jgi:hypothetical protein
MKLDEAALRSSAAKTGRTLDEMVQKIAERMFENIVRRTPVDTGWARANWIPSITAPDVTSPGTPPPGKSAPPDALPKISAAVRQGKTGDVFFLTNSVPYIIPLEYGHSKQAPAGMVRLSIEETRAFYREAIKS